MAEERRMPDLTGWSTLDLLRGAGRLYRRNATTFVGVLGVAFALTALVQAAGSLPGLTTLSRQFLAVVSALVAGTGSLALARAVLRRLRGQRASIGESYGFILERLSGYVGLLLLTVAIALGVGIVGFMAAGILISLGLGPLGSAVVAALMLAVVVALALVPFGFAEGLPVMRVLERSRTLASGEWPALLLCVGLYAVPFAVSFGLLPSTTVGLIVDVVVTVAYTPLPIAFLGMIYLRAVSAASDASTVGDAGA